MNEKKSAEEIEQVQNSQSINSKMSYNNSLLSEDRTISRQKNSFIKSSKFYNKLEEIDKKIIQLKIQKQEIKNKARQQERKDRTRRLIQNGALAEKYLNCENIEPKDFENLLNQIKIKLSSFN